GEEPYYTGMIGSRRRVAALLDLLRSEGLDPVRLEAVHTPIGLDIMAETPAEIAVSICAEMILTRRSRGTGREENETVLSRTEADHSLLRFLADGAEPCAVMTVISTKGSTPADSGAIMATDREGRIYGTIGGGAGEADAIRTGRGIIGTGGKCIVEVSMTNDVAADEGMACGGSMRVFVEDVV
ncbi:MAG: XdhC family protein, partial [Lachnospiraceae bacterium]|nr:XdhC family protein [Lachnospiraceae bacterium]